MSELSRDSNVLAWMIYHLETLRDMGFVSGGSHAMTDEGKKQVEDLMAGGFAPTFEEMNWAIHALNADNPENAESETPH